MRRASGVRASSAQNICIFCATRQLSAPTTAPASIQLVQRRQLHSSGKALSYASEAQVYKEESRPARPLTPKEQMQLMRQRLQQQQQQKQQPPQPQQPQAQPPQRQPQPNLSQFERSRPGSQNTFGSRPQQQGQRNIPPRGNNFFDYQGRNQNNNRYTPDRGQTNERGQPRQNRYNVNMDARPPMREAPQFGSLGNLRRRNETLGQQILSSATAPRETRPPPLRPKLDDDEIAKLLGSADTGRGKAEAARYERTYTPLARDNRAHMKCLNCGEKGHMSRECPERDQSGGYAADRKSEFNMGASKTSAASQQEVVLQKSEQVLYEPEENRRERDGINERRRGRFMMEEEAPVETRNRYEQPERRQRGAFNDRRARNRVVRGGEEEEEERYVSKMERKRLRAEAKKAAQLEKHEPTPVVLPEYISVANLASLLKLRVEDFVKKLEDLGFEDVQNDHILNAEHAGLVAQEYNFEPIVQVESEDGDLYPAEPLTSEEYALLPPRPPVVTIMGHVDHGKTTILDYIRSSSVAASEFGGITQHIGAFSVGLSSGKKITFLDTPGHAAFETMRARGANVTDIVVLVVAADDSVMPQTVEAIKHAQAAKVPIIVAINKCDKRQADPDRVKLDLGRHGLEVEDFGGDIQTVNVSGKTGLGITDLEEAIMLQSEVLDHRADPTANVEGWVLEGSTKKSGRVATILVRSGTLRRGDFLVAGNTWTRVRTLRNEAGVAVDEVTPGMPVEVDGWREQPIAGDIVLQAPSEERASSVAELRQEKVERLQMAKDVEAINESRRLEAERREAEAKAKDEDADAVSEPVKEASGPEIVSFIVKADVSGSVEAVIDSLVAIGNNEVGTRILRSGVGSPSEFDVEHAAVAKGHIVNFNTVIPSHISALAEEKGVRILDSNIIYRVVEDVKALLSEKLAPKITQRVTGEAEIAAVFEIGLGGQRKLRVAGSKVRNGVVEKGARAKVYREEEVVFDGTITSLKSQKKDVELMRKDTECGIAFQGWEGFEVGDKVQCYEEKSEKRTL
ncbi:initiation factor 2 [Sporormia fimetaria CBS 119925]|uniref:Translation initiation factor IF-2, mitochondrial n=1 Tax=Sporormia fimetaria CBS 119925 TaxID=1340428 RepID=A0A6A6VCF2_9PLEO|nr:initiation factor 2 [Sporormia fimetaria CBS 119925]